MKLQMHAIHFNADSRLIDFIQKKVDKLETFYDKMIDGEVFLRVNNKGIENKTIEIKINMPRNQLFVKEEAKSFEVATDMATKALRRQIRKFKDKEIALSISK